MSLMDVVVDAYDSWGDIMYGNSRKAVEYIKAKHDVKVLMEDNRFSNFLKGKVYR
jgi:uncharacterized Fe-S radical SAM superfamily protein PflX